MKSLVASTLLFCVMLGAIVLNCRYLGGVSEELRSAVEAIPHADGADGQLEALKRLDGVWKRHRDTVSLSVTVRVTEGIDDCIGEINAAVRYGDPLVLETAREHLLRILEDLCRYDAVRIGSVF